MTKHQNHRSIGRAGRSALATAAIAFLVANCATHQAGAQAFTFTTNGETYTELFDSMGSDTAFVPGWISTDLTMSVSDGSSNAGNIYNVGLSSDTDRAFGSISSGSVQPTFGASFVNNTTLSIGNISLTGFMEQWRTGSNAIVETVPFQFSFNATSLTTGTWISLTTFDLVEKLIDDNLNVAINGNLPENRTALTASTAVAWAAGQTMWIRWVDSDNTGSDGLYAIDDFKLTIATTLPPKDLTWNPTSTNWNTVGTNLNWLNGVTPSAFTTGDNVSFTNTGLATGSTVNVDAAGISAGNIIVSNSTGTYTFAGGAISGTGTLTKSNAGTLLLSTTFNGAGVIITGGTVQTDAADRIGDSVGVSISEGGTLDLNNNNETTGAVQLAGGRIITGTGTLTPTGNIAATASTTTSRISGKLDTGSSGRTFSAEDGPSAVDLLIDAILNGSGRNIVSGPGLVEFSGDNSLHTGGVTVLGGAAPGNVSIGHANALGTGTVFLNGGSINVSTALTGVVAPVSLGGNATLSGSPVEWLGGWTFAFAGPQSRTLTVNNQTTLSINGSDDTLSLGGTGSFTFAGETNALATLNVDADTVTAAVNGSLTAAVNVNSGTLGGGGTITGAVAVGTLGVISPGSGGIGTLSLGALSFSSNGAFKLELNSTTRTADKIIATGPVDLTFGPTLTASDLGSAILTLATDFTIIDNTGTDPITGTFLGYDDDSTIIIGANNFIIDYNGGTGNDLVLHLVPEPGTGTLAFLGLASLAGLRRRRS